MFGFLKSKNKYYSKKKLTQWSLNHKLEELLEVLNSGDPLSKVRTIALLESHNLMNVKNVLNETLNDSNKFVALKACESIINMGANADEQKAIDIVLKKYNAKKMESQDPEDSIYFHIKDVVNNKY